jgi:hypothetical protein
VCKENNTEPKIVSRYRHFSSKNKILHETVKIYNIFLNFFDIFCADRNTKTVHLYSIWLVYTVHYCEHICTVHVQCTSDSDSIINENSYSVDSAALHISPHFDSCSSEIIAFLSVDSRPSSELQVLLSSCINYDLPGTVAEDILSSFWHLWKDQDLNCCCSWLRFSCTPPMVL